MAQASTDLSIFVNTLGLIERPHDRTELPCCAVWTEAKGVSIGWVGSYMKARVLQI